MAISDNYAPTKVLGNGVTDIFTATWNVIAEAYLRVYLENTTTGVQVLQTEGVDFDLTSFDGTGLSITFAPYTTPPSTEYVIIAREIAQDQATPYRTSTGYQGSVLENSFDKVTSMVQDMQEALGRTPQLPIGSPATSVALPSVPVDGYGIVWDGTTGLMRNTTASLEDLETNAAVVTANIANVNLVGGSIANVNTVAGISANVTTVAGISADVTAAAGVSGDITTVAGVSADVTTVAGIPANVTTVAGISADVTIVAADGTDIGVVAGDTIPINALGSISADISTVSGISANVTTVAGISANVTTVAGISANVTTVAGISSDVTTVAGIDSDVTTVAADGADIGVVAGISADVTAVAAVADQIETLLDLSINDQTDSYILVLTDAGKYVRMDKATALNLTVPPNASVAFPTGTQILVRQVGAGQLTIVEGSGVTVNISETLLLRTQGSSATLVKVGTNEWDLAGDVEAA